uniref:Uncharacterized protein n=1 Tax=Mycena chlorophos TaxID=658473 RepID=A0ABQ0LE91_MYCCL|nr:predicted protein [Mycena chlorophos]
MKRATALFCAGLALTVGSLAQQEIMFSFSIPAEGISPVWDLPLDTVLMDVHNTDNYDLNGTLADAQWAALMPPNGGIVELGPHGEKFMLSMAHQLQCLDVIRQDYVAGWEGRRTTPNGEVSARAHHCLNYIRQMVLCRGDRRLEQVVDPFGAHAVQVRGTQTCKDWTRVLDSMAEAQRRTQP